MGNRYEKAIHKTGKINEKMLNFTNKQINAS